MQGMVRSTSSQASAADWLQSGKPLVWFVFCWVWAILSVPVWGSSQGLGSDSGIVKTSQSVQSPVAAQRPDRNSQAANLAPDVASRFAVENLAAGEQSAGGHQAPSFQRHVSPLFGRLGCNGRSCHGSFQGQGGFQLSLFGYDFQADHNALMAEGSGRIDLEAPEESLILIKPTDAEGHGGGKRFEKGSWEYNLLKNWIAGGAKAVAEPERLVALEVTPAAVDFSVHPQQQLQVIARWANGSEEDVTALARFQSKDPALAEVDELGLVRGGDPGDTHVIVSYDNAVVPVEVYRPIAPPQATPAGVLGGWGQVDQLVQSKLERLGLIRSPEVDDLTFLRRVSLDLCGNLPTPAEIKQFALDSRPDKRARKIDELLETPAYAATWTTFLCDITGNNSQELRDVSVNSDLAAQLWYDWIYDRVRRNVPYSELVRGMVLGRSREGEESYTAYCERMSRMLSEKDSSAFVAVDSMPLYWMRRETQSLEERTISFAHAFLGVQIQCAQCHKHPFDQWSKEDFAQFSRFFSGVEFSRGRPKSPIEREELVKLYESLGIAPNSRGGTLQKQIAEAAKAGKTVPFPQLYVTKPKIQRTREEQQALAKSGKRGPLYYTDATLLGAESVELQGIADVREPVLDWMLESDNPYFARALVNRVWARYFGLGIVNPVDDLSRANPPSNAPLLDYLAAGFIRSGYDLKWLHREIASSRTYQTSWEVNATNAGDRRNFSRAIPRRLTAEAVVDSCLQATANTPDNASFRETLTDRASAIAGTSLGRANNRGRNASFALDAFGRSTRSNNCDCDRSSETSLIQTVYLQNDRDIHTLLARPEGWVSEVRKELAPPAKEGALSVEELRSRIERVQRQQSAARKAGNSKQMEQLAKRLELFSKQLDVALTAERKQLNSAEAVAKRESLVVEAYLRTLSRFPTTEEIQRCERFFEESPDLAAGLSGVMWALINTKEFIVNH